MTDKPRRILVLCPFPEGVAAAQRLKYEQYFPHWREHGYQVTVAPFMDQDMWRIVYTRGNCAAKILGTLRGYCRRVRDLFRVGGYDLVYLPLWVTPLGSSLFERVVAALSRRLVFDIEDNLLQQKPNHVNPLAKLLKSPAKTRHLIEVADHVITSSPFLNDHCLTMNRRRACTYITSSVDTTRFVPVNRYQNDRPVVIGWTGTFSSRPYLDLLRPVFLELSRRCRFRLLVIGNFDYDLPGVDLRVIQWNRDSEVRDLQRIDIGVYPLVDDRWVLGKSGLKAIQYMAFGLPTVATGVGTTPSIIRHLENGWLVKTDEQWLEALETLVRDPELRARLGRAARRTVEETYSLEAVKSQYLAVLDGLF